MFGTLGILWADIDHSKSNRPPLRPHSIMRWLGLLSVLAATMSFAGAAPHSINPRWWPLDLFRDPKELYQECLSDPVRTSSYMFMET